jgi:hypothetical protein
LKDVGKGSDLGTGLLVEIVIRGLIGCGSFFGHAQTNNGNATKTASATMRLWFDFHSKEGMQLKSS